MVAWHREQGFAGIQFNAVVETNTGAVRLWQDLGFTIVGTVPGAFESTRARPRRPARDVPTAHPVSLREVPRLVWVLAAGRFLGSTSSYLMLFLTLYLTGPRDLSVTTAGLIVGGSGAGHAARQLHRRRAGATGSVTGSVLLLASSVVGVGLVSIPWASGLSRSPPCSRSWAT